MHKDRWDTSKTVCKKALALGRMTSDECRVRVKQWLLAGLTIGDRPDARTAHVHFTNPHEFPHKTEEEVDAEARALRSGSALSCDDAAEKVGGEIATPAEAALVASSSASSSSASAAVPAPGTPPLVAEAMTRMMEAGALPVTSVEQRRRNRLTRGSNYGVPDFYKAALKAGYLRPNLQAPRGYRWKATRQGWSMLPQGG